MSTCGTSTPLSTKTALLPTPKMSLLLGLTGASTSTVVSYFGSMNFLDDQKTFDDTFDT